MWAILKKPQTKVAEVSRAPWTKRAPQVHKIGWRSSRHQHLSTESNGKLAATSAHQNPFERKRDHWDCSSLCQLLMLLFWDLRSQILYRKPLFEVGDSLSVLPYSNPADDGPQVVAQKWPSVVVD
eukprot:CAMPEP_0169168578 /NCGR_PEP_ID=MMETSP1015-20121227/61068_1 /TAXON_ID=342587 /ORGANISM="Karlodinium micrum, Strain CCMP2283" /LENGTH=124 /DNA_ID=CAMNT_0009241341 /DNA_START=96 /DNA_END=470 /DNA_ORIENTATION=+